jgi:chromosome segregation ATPase
LAAPTREYQQNEVIFNYREIGEAKRARKNQFLEEIEARIAEAEREITGLEELQEEERAEMGALGREQARVGEQLSRNVEVGRVQQQVGRVTGWGEDEGRQPPPSIHP